MDQAAPHSSPADSGPGKINTGFAFAPSTPQGGGALKGLGEQFSTNPFTGTAALSIPVPVPEARGLEPELSIAYGSGGGAGVFGLGFELSLPWIGLRTDRVRPRYNGEDDYVMKGMDVLVPRRSPGDSENDEREVRLDGRVFRVRQYIPRVESAFARIERFRAGRDIHWRVTDRENRAHIYGLTDEARVRPGSRPDRVFRWHLQETRDARGNRIVYEYKREDNAGAADETHRASDARVHLKRVKYANYGSDRWAFEIVLDYGEHEPGLGPREERPWTRRADSFSDFTAAFETRVHRLCRNILVFHHLPDSSGEIVSRLVNRLELEYDETPTRTLLKKARRVGYRLEQGEYKTAALPALELDYTSFEPRLGEYKELRTTTERFIPGVPDGDAWRFLDLDGEGLPGALHTRDGAVLYWAPRGEGRLDEARSLFQFPADRNGESVEYHLRDLENSGRMNLVVTGSERNGYYEIEPDGSWKTYRAFRHALIQPENLARDHVDITGDGFSDVLAYGENSILINRSRGKLGFGKTISLTRRRDFPAGNFAWRREVVTYANIFGDGLSHRIRVRAGTLEVWPNLGYGRFGSAISLQNAPRFPGDFNASRVRLGDIDGTGTTDIIYLHAGHFTVYFNRAGNGFDDGVDFPLPEGFDDFDQVSVADIEGTGTACLVLSRNKPEIRHVYFDFARGRKPYLLNKIENNMGARTRLEYKPSTHFYLEDRREDRPWITRLPFPVQVVERSETSDLISGTRLVSRFAYHHGYYDPFYREFRGFGMVEQWDAESLEEQISARDSAQSKDDDIAFDANPEELHAPPRHTRTWYHTGAFLDRGPVSRQFAGEYYSGDVQAPSLPDSDFQGDLNGVRPENLFWAYRALGGLVLREEIYGPDEESVHPYSVSENRFTVRLLQSDQAAPAPVFSVLPAESITIHYERNPDDPRMEHEVLLESDEFDLPLKSLRVFYGRRPGAKRSSDQAFTRAILNTTRFAHETTDFYRLGTAVENRTMEITGLVPSDNDASRLLNMSVLRERIATALMNILPYEKIQDPDSPEPRARLLKHARNYYRRDDADETAPFGESTALGLPRYQETAVMSAELVRLAYQDRVSDAMLREEGGYVFADGLWWKPGDTTHYHPDVFFQATGSTDPFGARTEIAYDEFALAVVSMKNPLGLTVRTRLDYDALAPAETMDPNGIRVSALFDALGRVLMRSVAHTADGEILRGDDPLTETPADQPDMDRVLARPAEFLRGAGEYFLYDDHAFVRRGSPARAMHVQRRRFVHEPGDVDPAGGEFAQEDEPVIHIVYSDGYGRIVQSKQLTDPGPRDADGNIRLDAQGNPVFEEATRRWRVTGRVVHDNKSRPVKQYEPFFSPTHEYEGERELREYGITPILFYDAPGRVFRVHTPKGFLVRTNFGAWEQSVYDENDTIREASYFLENEDNADPEFKDELDALKKTLPHADTPTISERDCVGNEIASIQFLGTGARLRTRSRPDIEGNVLELADPRLSETGVAANLRNTYNMVGEILLAEGADNGARRELRNAAGNTIHAWDQAGYQVSMRYDLLQRPVHRLVKHVGEGLNQIVERFTYGEELEDREGAMRGNLLGKVVVHRHQGGVDFLDAASIGGNAEKTRRRLRREYKREANWNDPNGEELEDELWECAMFYNALEWATRARTPDGSISRYLRNPVGLLTQLRVTQPGETERVFIENIEYDARNQRRTITRGNRTSTRYEYEPTTFRLFKTETRRMRADGSPGEILQDISYSYDPVGNLTRIRDAGHRRVFNANSVVEPLCDYTYDALYRLIRASGREHPGLSGTEHKDFRARDPKHAPALPGLNDGHGLTPYSREYEYDHAGNLLRMRHRAADTAASWSRVFTVSDSSNRAFETANMRGRSLEELYDANGNLTRLDHLSALRWNYRDNIQSAEIINRDDEDAPSDAEYQVYDARGDRIRRVRERLIKRGAARLEFQCDARGNRLEKSVLHKEADVIEIDEKIYLNGVEIKRIRRVAPAGESRTLLERRTLHVMDGEHRLALTHRWTVNNTRRERPEGELQTRYQYDNHLGSASLELDDEGLVISYEEYFPYGGTSLIAGRNRCEVDLKEYRYSGKERDDATGLYYYGARYYAPWFARWLSSDPAGMVDGPNTYAFVRGNPVKFTDAVGRSARFLFGLIAASIYLRGAGDQIDPRRLLRAVGIGVTIGTLIDRQETRFWRGRQAIALSQVEYYQYQRDRAANAEERGALGQRIGRAMQDVWLYQRQINAIGLTTEPPQQVWRTRRSNFAQYREPNSMTVALNIQTGRYAVGTSAAGRMPYDSVTLADDHAFRDQTHVMQRDDSATIHSEPNAMEGLRRRGHLPASPRGLVLATRSDTGALKSLCEDCHPAFPNVDSVTDHRLYQRFRREREAAILARGLGRILLVLRAMIRIGALQNAAPRLFRDPHDDSKGGGSGPSSGSGSGKMQTDP